MKEVLYDMEWLEISAGSVQKAKEEALDHLGVHESDAEFEVLSEGKTGLFGRVKETARVRARVVPTPVRPKESRSRGHDNRKSRSSRRSQATRQARSGEQAKSTEPKASRDDVSSESTGAAEVDGQSDRGRGDGRPRGTSRRKIDKSAKKDAKSMIDDDSRGPTLVEQAGMAEDFVDGIATTMGIKLTFARRDLESGILRIEATGENIGLLVGRRGMTAQAIDELVRTVLQRSGGTTREGKIRMDIGGMRARRAASLAEFTRKVADEVIESGEEMALEAMNRMDRKIVHDVVTEIDEVESRSEGEDPHRRVVIMSVRD